VIWPSSTARPTRPLFLNTECVVGDHADACVGVGEQQFDEALNEGLSLLLVAHISCRLVLGGAVALPALSGCLRDPSSAARSTRERSSRQRERAEWSRLLRSRRESEPPGHWRIGEIGAVSGPR
jgi:hypothetical protein